MSINSEKAKGDIAHLLAQPNIFDKPMELPLVKSKTSIVFRGEEGVSGFNLHSYITYFEGKFWAIWSSGLQDEDNLGQVIRYATSSDGHDWSEEAILTDPPKTTDGYGTCIARGIFVHAGVLTALVAFFDHRIPGVSWLNLRLMRFVWDGKGWINKGVYLDDCMNNYPPRPIKDRLFMTNRNSRAEMRTALADSLEGENWTVTPLGENWSAGALSEPSWYIDPEGTVHMIIRTRGDLHRSISTDDGLTWSQPLETDYPDATSKNYTGRLSNGSYYLINNPGESRDPLAISFSQDGWVFDGPLLLRKDASERRYPGRAKNNRSFQYPHALEHNGSFWVIYSTNKEDIEISEVLLSDLN